MEICDFYRNKNDRCEVIHITNFAIPVDKSKFNKDSMIVIATPVILMDDEGDEQYVFTEYHNSYYGSVEEFERDYEFVANQEMIREEFGSNDYYPDVLRWMIDKQ